MVDRTLKSNYYYYYLCVATQCSVRYGLHLPPLSGGDSVALGMVSIFLHFLGSRSPPALLFGDSSALNQFNQTKDAPTFYKVRLPTLQNAEDRHCVFSVEADIIINCCFQLLSRRPPLASPSQNLLPHSPLLHPSPPSPPPPPPFSAISAIYAQRNEPVAVSVSAWSQTALYKWTLTLTKIKT